MSLQYPACDNYITVEGGSHSQKLLENLCIDQICCSHPDLDGDITPGKPQYIMNAIVPSLVSRDCSYSPSFHPQ